MRDLIRLVENASLESVVNVDAAVKRLVQSIHADGFDIVQSEIKLEQGLDPYNDPTPSNIEELVKEWCHGALYDAYYKVAQHIQGGKMRAWREITAPKGWTPEHQHPGIYWSWSEGAAEAHWGWSGEEGDNLLKWMMYGEFNATDIDWLSTLIQNANPSYEDEQEVRINPNAHVDILKYWEK